MACTKPLSARFSIREDGKKNIVFDNNLAKGFLLGLNPLGSELNCIKIPCGQCTSCRLERSRQWAIRCMHEASLHDENCFLTLTYDDDHLPKGGSLFFEDFQKFMKRLRKHFVKKCPAGLTKEERDLYFKHNRIRYYHCGEYGDRTRRPHYHCLLFGLDPLDKYLWSRTEFSKLYVSHTINRIWGKGNVIIGDCNFHTAAYTARYIMKKVNGKLADDHYKTFNPDTGEIVQLKPEYTTMSRSPGIGSDWIKARHKYVYDDDFVIVNGKKCKPPKFYDSVYELIDSDNMELTRIYRELDLLKKKKRDPRVFTSKFLNIKAILTDNSVNRLGRDIV